MADKPKEPTFAEILLLLYRGIVESEGCRRLSVALGGLCAITMAVIGWVVNKSNVDWQRFAFAVAIAFFVPWGLTQIVCWVIEGFTRARQSN
jgi:TRAP-type uncharacterized transport system fused permease subunit